MARARNIKPGFFKNETLVELPFEHRLLFVGLWTLADKSGRLEDRVKRIKMELFPADNVDVEAGMALLERNEFIQRYEVDGVALVQILNFSKHQSPHHTEKNSELPGPNGELTVKEPSKDSDSPKPLRGNPPDSLIHRFTDSLNTDSTDTASVPESVVPQPVKKAKTSAKPKGIHPDELTDLGVDEQVAKEFIAMRNGRRSPLTKLALAGMQREAAKAGWSLEDAMRKAVERGWLAFEAKWVDPDKNQGPRANRPQKFDPLGHINQNRVREHDIIDI